jgi:hypothetical protein
VAQGDSPAQLFAVVDRLGRLPRLAIQVERQSGRQKIGLTEIDADAAVER